MSARPTEQNPINSQQPTFFLIIWNLDVHHNKEEKNFCHFIRFIMTLSCANAFIYLIDTQ